MKSLDEQIAVMTAYKNGAAIEAARLLDGIWSPCDRAPRWNWHDWDYRVAERKPREVVLRECGTAWATPETASFVLPGGKFVRFREVLPPDPKLISLRFQVNHNGEFFPTGRTVPHGRVLECGKTIDFIEVQS